MKYFIVFILPLLISCGGKIVSNQTDNPNDPFNPIDKFPPLEDQFPGAIVQSVGTEPSAIMTGSDSSLIIKGNIAYFNKEIITNFSSEIKKIGVGNVIVYGGNYAIIKGLLVNNDYSLAYVTLKDGSSKPIETSGSNFEIYRGFNSLSHWHSQDQNDKLDILNLDITINPDLVTGNRGPVYVACYADEIADSEELELYDTWETSSDNFIKIFTPTESLHAGSSQRHNGFYDEVNHTGYRRLRELVVANSFVKIDGIAAKISDPPVGAFHFTLVEQDNAEIELSNSIAYHTGTNYGAVTIRSSTISMAKIKIWNNIAIVTPSGVPASEFHLFAPSGTQYDLYMYNNSIYIQNGMGVYMYRYRFTLFNNVAIGTSRSFHTEWSTDMGSERNVGCPSNTNNFSLTATLSSGVPSNYFNSSTDLRLLTPSGGNFAHELISQGIDLSADSNIPIKYDISGDLRVNWDIGADGL